MLCSDVCEYFVFCVDVYVFTPIQKSLEQIATQNRTELQEKSA